MRFKDDPTLLHCRIVLDCKEGNLCKVATPDRDINETKLEPGAVFTEVLRMVGGRLPRHIRERDTYLPKHTDQGEFTERELLELCNQAKASGYGQGLSHRITGKLVEGRRVVDFDRVGPGGEVVDEKLPDETDDIWIAVYRSGGKGIGEEVAPPKDSNVMNVGGKTFVLYSIGGDEVLARKVGPNEVEKLGGLLRMGAPIAEDRDLRTLPVLFDVAEERWRTLAEAVPEYEEVDFDDWPLQGPRSVFRDVRQLRRQGMDFVQHHESWLKKSGVRSGDRSVYEHACICRVLNYMASYDQLNLPSLASAEALNRRRALIEIAHQGRPEAPSYEGAEEILGIREAGDGSVIDPAITSHAAKRQAAKAEVMKQKRLAAEERRFINKTKTEDEDDRGKGRGRGRGKDAPKDP